MVTARMNTTPGWRAVEVVAVFAVALLTWRVLPPAVPALLLIIGVVVIGVAGVGIAVSGMGSLSERLRPKPSEAAGLAEAGSWLDDCFGLQPLDDATALWLLASVIDVDADADLFEEWFLDIIRAVESDLDHQLEELVESFGPGRPQLG